MQLLQVGKIYMPNCYPYEIRKDKTLEYFIYGEGWKRTKKYKIVENIELPERNEKLSWFKIAVLHDKYGIEVSNKYAENKTAGIVSRQSVYGYHSLYSAIKDIIPQNFNEDFFDCLASDYMLSCFGLYVLDIAATDKRLSKKDSEYDCDNCTYKGKAISMSEYVSLKYGKEYVSIIDKLLQTEVTV